ncbi:hypothetical protein FQR65_LT07608 [Abscondita terminalis]|nr:hypothetical protein FQR65_LT07608 [Abscondita terminalis]
MINPITKKVLTVKDLLIKSTKLAMALRKMLLQKGDVVVLISENNFHCYVVACATFFCGAVLHLVNFAYLQGELKHAFLLSKPKFIFSSNTAMSNLFLVKDKIDSIKQIISVDGNSLFKVRTMKKLIEGVKSCDDFEPTFTNSTETVILLMSSGTTGLPKCVELTHQSLVPVMNFSCEPNYNHITSKDITVLVMPFIHIYGFLIHLFAITNSAIVIQLKSFKPDVYLQAVEDYKATKLCVVPTILQFLVGPIASKFKFPSVQDISIGGGALSDEVYEKARRKFSRASVRLLYGCTETVGISIGQKASDMFNGLGKPVYNTTIKIINRKTNAILGPYQEGEICVKTHSMMKGYLNNPSETKNSFDGNGFYRTGDMGYFDKNQNFYMVGRVKDLIKYKDYQVSPAEIEAVVISYPGVKDCGVVSVKDKTYGELPLALVVREEGSEVTAKEIINFVSAKLSHHKQLHGGVRFVKEIPRSSFGKILRKELSKL